MGKYQQGFLACLQYEVVKRKKKMIVASTTWEKPSPYKPTKLFAINFQKIPLIVFKKGDVMIGTDDPHKAVEIMNLIKYNLLFLGYRESYSIRLDSLHEIGYNTNFGYDFSQLGTEPCTTHIGYGVTESHLKKAILKSIIISKKKPEIAEQLRLLSDSQRLLDNFEFSASFLLSYLIVERELFTKWDDKIKSLELENKRQSQLLDHDKMWQTARVIEISHLLKIINKDQYDLLNKFRITRNSLAHKGTSVSEGEAHHSFNMAENLVYKKVNKIKIPDINKVTWH